MVIKSPNVTCKYNDSIKLEKLVIFENRMHRCVDCCKHICLEKCQHIRSQHKKEPVLSLTVTSPLEERTQTNWQFEMCLLYE